MSDLVAEASVDTDEMTVRLQTLGVEDESIDDVRTVAMRAERRLADEGVEHLVTRLPQLDIADDGKAAELSIFGTLGEGGMGVVESAWQHSVGREVAIKKLRSGAGDTESKSALALAREGWATGALEHPNVIPVYEMGRDEDDQPRIVMKKVEGTSWRQMIDEPAAAPDWFDASDPLRMHLEVFIEVTHAVDFAHDRGVIHRDLKPENVMLGDFGEVYVLDWGIAAAIDGDASGRLLDVDDIDRPEGTPAYMAPEMVDPDEFSIDVHTDVFLLGAILYEILTGEPPYRGKTVYQIMIDAFRCRPPEFGDGVPARLAEICRRAMAREPDERYQGVAPLRRAVQDYLRYRRAERLAAEGDGALRRMEWLCARESDGESVDDRQLHNALGRCRFAYEQALEIDSGNERALRGLQRALETMAERALDDGAHRAASMFIADLPRSNPSLSHRLQRLHDELEHQQQDYEKLRKLERSVDQELGRFSRAKGVALIGAFITALAIVASVFVEPRLADEGLDYTVKFGYQFALVFGVGAVVLFARTRFFDNQVNRQLFVGTWILFAVGLLQNASGYFAGLEVWPVLSSETLLYAGGATLMAVFFDRRVFWPGVPFYLLAIAGSIWPEYAVQMNPVANIVAFMTIVYLWWPSDQESG